MFLQKMPAHGGLSGKELAERQAYEAEITEAVEHAFQAAPSYGQWFSEGGDRDDIIYGLFRDFNPTVALDRDIIFDCSCSREKYLSAVSGKTVTTVLPLPKIFARRFAAATFVPEEMPHIIPSSLAKSFEV